MPRKRKFPSIVATIAMVAASVGLIAVSGSASATEGTKLDWTGQGSSNLPCASGGHWVLTGHGITSAVATVGNDHGDMVQNGEGSFSFDSTGSIDANTVAYAIYQGEAKNPQFVLSHCTDSPPPPVTCPEGTTWTDANHNGMVDEGECASTPPPKTCPSGTTWTDKNHNGSVDEGECESTPPPKTCPAGTTWNDANHNGVVDNGECASTQPPEQCPRGTTWHDNNGNGVVEPELKECVEYAVPPPHPKPKPKCTTLANGECVPTAVAETGLSESSSLPVWEYALAALAALLFVPLGGLGLRRAFVKIRR